MSPLAAVWRTKRYLLNKNGENVLPFEYEDAGKFSDGLAYVKKNGRYGYGQYGKYGQQGYGNNK